MTGTELKQARRELGLSANWCAQFVGRMSLRSWQYLEDGRADTSGAIETKPVPPDVQQKMREIVQLVEKRNKIT